MEIDPRPVFLFFWGELSHCGQKKKKKGKKTPSANCRNISFGGKKKREKIAILAHFLLWMIASPLT